MKHHLTEAELLAWIDRELDPDERVRVNQHLEACAACRQSLSDLRSVAETFSGAMLRYDEDVAPEPAVPAEPAIPLVPAATTRPAPAEPAPDRSGRRAGAVPRWAGRAAAVVLLLGAAAAAAMVPGSPVYDWLNDRPAVQPPVTSPIVEPEPAATVPGASITVRPPDGRLRVRIRNFAPGTRVVARLTERSEAVATLPDGATNARFIVAPGTLEVVGPGATAGGSDAAGAVELLLPRSMRAGVIELDGKVVARVADGRLTTLRQVSRRSGDEAVFEVGG